LLDACDRLVGRLRRGDALGHHLVDRLRPDPLWLWGPILAMLTGAGGGILRDIVRQAGTIASLKTELYAEVALLWGLVLSGYLLWRIPDLDPDELVPVIVAVVVGAFVTRMAAVLFRIKSPLFIQMPAASVPAHKD
jgi:polar amino acid transport system substrate-binding protein